MAKLTKKYQVQFEDNSSKVLAELKGKEGLICHAIGLKWEKIVKQIITIKGIVDTGALRNSMTFTVSMNKDEITVGSRLDYAAHNELYNKKGNFLKPSVLDYREVYEDLAEQILKK